ncbi:hypothetical protein [Levilactobacillus parabrevis]|uniref:Uncharacterized protein n=1 Tax=Levilactobacillus parabrevis ATCC 53295 TaxID=1267003 RepID=A0A0R1H0R9_9LACO|nr:hypothetical protein [Levilactobacillus parabrevis]KRK36295.1 hypothetical protein FD07_GL000929 [Levilactobacillus parabrevis ATCC 53295]KRO05670.1 hypothetical protein IV61_GL001026 [Levilactobacillus parabrevis]
MRDKKQDRQQLYSDAYFEKGHWGLKIRQTLIGLLGWVCVFVPVIITVLSFWASYNPKIIHLWSYNEGIFEIKFIGVLLLFAFVLVSLFAVGMTIIQNRKRDRVVEQWPTFNPINQRKRETQLGKFMDERFGDQEFRENVRHYQVKPEQNLDTDQIHKLYEQHDLNDLDE